ncbi:MAG: NADH-quinone oxidoreductase subunit D [Chloroherpetonaceae bacterium]|nr:NADH-quinone oxidoreductase subunit D [bacterium]HAW07605.1 NADH-quinone oxidoreductase subunit D [Bacteroidota bacterium]
MSEIRDVAIDLGNVHTEHMKLNVGPQHPSTHGVLRLMVELEGEIVVDVVPHIGYLHRCFEKVCEQNTYTQIVPYVDRMDYVNSMNNELPYVIGVEKLLGITVSERIEAIRVICAELDRIASHEIAVATFGMDAGAFTPFLYLFRDREKILWVLEKLSGSRLLYNYIRIGGLMRDVYPTFKDDLRDIIKTVRETNAEINNLLNDNKIFVERCANIGILPPDVAINYGASGPMLRASGVRHDLRRVDPYSIYNKLDFEVCVGTGTMGTVGDSWDRNWVRMLEMEQSLRIIEQAMEMITDSSEDVRAGIPKRIAPKGELYSRAENPKGELGFYIVGDGKAKPQRVKGRSPCYVNLSIIPEISKGYMFADLIIILGSIDIVLGEIDR